jgi:FkbM family methyltransferase
MYSMKKGTNPIKCKLRNGDEIAMEHDTTSYLTHFLGSKMMDAKDVIDLLSSGIIKFRYKGTELKMKLRGVDSNNEFNGDIDHVFCKEDYKFLTTKGNNVIDIGGNIGDTPIYFALNGAEKIVAIEPYPYSFEMAKYNIEINHFQAKIQLFNAGYGQDGEIVVGNSQVNAGSNLIESTKGSIKIPIMSMKHILEKSGFDPHAPIYLKMDCEGCEYNLLHEEKETLRRFERIQIEYHYGINGLDELFKELGYIVDFTNPIETYNINSSDPKMSVGFLYAKRGKS